MTIDMKMKLFKVLDVLCALSMVSMLIMVFAVMIYGRDYIPTLTEMIVAFTIWFGPLVIDVKTTNLRRKVYIEYDSKESK